MSPPWLKELTGSWSAWSHHTCSDTTCTIYHLVKIGRTGAVREAECRNTFTNRLDKHWRGHPMRLDYNYYDLGMRSPTDQEEVIYEIASQA